MERLLLIGPHFHYFMDSIKNAFEELGYNVCLETYDDPIHPYNQINKIRYKLSNDKAKQKLVSQQRWQQHIESTWKTFAPKIVIIVNGANLLPESVKLFGTKSKVAIWLFDSVTRFPELMDNLPFANHVFCYEKNDIQLLKDRLGIYSTFLPQAVDTNIYHPLNIEKEYDICFAGDIYSSKKRQQLLDAVCKKFKDKKICFYGIATPWYKNFFKWLFRKNRDIYKNKNISGEELNVLYNSSQVVLNIHNEQQNDGANPKVYEISASGAFQICDSNAYIQSLFKNNEILLYNSEKELLQQIEKALAEQPHFTLAAQFAQQHSYKQRMQQLLCDMDSSTQKETYL